MDPTVMAAWIDFAATVISALVAALLGVRWLNQQHMQEKLKEAKADTAFCWKLSAFTRRLRNQMLQCLQSAKHVPKRRRAVLAGQERTQKAKWGQSDVLLQM